MTPEPNFLDDLLCHRAFTMNASHDDCEDVVLQAYRQGAKDALDLCHRLRDGGLVWAEDIEELREQVDEP